jgi:hypothetical protein
MIQSFVDYGFFRNPNHAIWFCCTVAILATVLVQRMFPRAAWTVLVTGLAVHVSPILNALRVAAKHEQSDLYSPDCIAFNSVMLAAYVGVYFMFRKLNRSRPRVSDPKRID